MSHFPILISIYTTMAFIMTFYKAQNVFDVYIPQPCPVLPVPNDLLLPTISLPFHE